MTVIQERSNSNVPTVHDTRGLDLSGILGGAGGIGGLLTRSSGYNASTGAWSTHDYYHADGSGNITLLISNSTTPTIRAQYEYDPFGRIQAQSGTLTSTNTQHFSSKEQIGSSPLSYYGYRFYHAEVQRWINRDPIEESGGLNLYRFVGNSPTNYYDSFGLSGDNELDAMTGGDLLTPLSPYAPGVDTARFASALGEAGNALTDPCKYKQVSEELSSITGPLGDLFSAIAAGLSLSLGDAAGVYSNLANMINPLGASGNNLNGFASRMVQHHSTPRAIINKLPPSVRSHPDVVDRRGNPNKIPVFEITHRQIHSSPAGSYYPGGDYNRRFDYLIRENGGYDVMTPQQINNIRDQVVGEFGL